ncbi:unnamed protein product [Nippostrongylus brasiliensis]|uniref:DM5 domain-containing protein n=1 Tax=Nippostrongylus brasiliensis TaxID=27835 RepID=A0A0N4Y695_NIPBR|nr:unnamed protein product [Nippostrongylus brasiliensis]
MRRSAPKSSNAGAMKKLSEFIGEPQKVDRAYVKTPFSDTLEEAKLHQREKDSVDFISTNQGIKNEVQEQAYIVVVEPPRYQDVSVVEFINNTQLIEKKALEVVHSTLIKPPRDQSVSEPLISTDQGIKSEALELVYSFLTVPPTEQSVTGYLETNELKKEVAQEVYGTFIVPPADQNASDTFL